MQSRPRFKMPTVQEILHTYDICIKLCVFSAATLRLGLFSIIVISSKDPSPWLRINPSLFDKPQIWFINIPESFLPEK